MLDSPYAEEDLCDTIRAALAKDVAGQEQRKRRHAIRDRLEQLTPQEHGVLTVMLAGQQNKTIADAMDISIRTVAARRRDILAKMQADSTAELIRTVVEARVDAENA